MHEKKIGHTGTLDPQAEGVLPVCIGNATKLCGLLMDKRKEYEAVLLLGLTTDTQDLTGTVTGRAQDWDDIEKNLKNEERNDGLRERTDDHQNESNIHKETAEQINPRKTKRTKTEKQAETETENSTGTKAEKQIVSEVEKNSETVRILGNVADVTEESIRTVIMSFLGKSEQIPPMYSALKVGGKKLYELAREGKEVERKPREIELYKIDIIQIDLPRVRFAVECSKGTYIRTLCADIGEKAGCGGAMESLLRTRVDRFVLEEAKKLSEIEEYARSGRIDEILIQADQMFMTYPACHVKETGLKAVQNGNALPFDRICAFSDDLLRKNDMMSEDAVITDGVTEPNDGSWSYDADQNSSADGNGNTNSAATSPGLIRIYDESGRFYGLYEVNPDDKLCKPYKMFL